MVMQGDECSGPGLTCVDRGVLVGMRRRRLGPRLPRTHALCEPCVCRTGISPSVCGRRTRAELHIQDMPPRMLPSSAALRRGASCRYPCCSFPCSGLRAHGTLHSPRPSIGEAMQALASLSASARCRVGVGPWECRILERSRISRPCMQDPQYRLLRIHLPRTPVNKNVCCYSRAVADRSLYSMLHYARGLAGPSKQLPGVCLGLGVYVTNMPLGIPRCAGTPRQ